MGCSQVEVTEDVSISQGVTQSHDDGEQTQEGVNQQLDHKTPDKVQQAKVEIMPKEADLSSFLHVYSKVYKQSPSQIGLGIKNTKKDDALIAVLQCLAHNGAMVIDYRMFDHQEEYKFERHQCITCMIQEMIKLAHEDNSVLMLI